MDRNLCLLFNGSQLHCRLWLLYRLAHLLVLIRMLSRILNLIKGFNIALHFFRAERAFPGLIFCDLQAIEAHPIVAAGNDYIVQIQVCFETYHAF